MPNGRLRVGRIPYINCYPVYGAVDRGVVSLDATLIDGGPTELNRQGPDVGPQYRSAVFYTSDAQRRATEAYIAQLQKSGAVKRKIVTEVAPARGFTVAEAYHQDYATLHPDQPYIRYNDAPKIAQLKAKLPGHKNVPAGSSHSVTVSL